VPRAECCEKACCRDSYLYLMGLKHLNKHLNFDASVPKWKMRKWYQQEPGESTKENTALGESTAAREHNF